MSYNSNQPAAALGWDSPVQASNDADFTPLPAGDYDYVIVDLERAEFPGSAKMAPSPMARLTIECTGPGGNGTVRTNIILNSMLTWKITQLAKSCGILDPGAQPGSSFQMPWGSLVGKRGRCQISQRTYEWNGETRKASDVARWLPASTQRTYRDPAPGSAF